MKTICIYPSTYLKKKTQSAVRLSIRDKAINPISQEYTKLTADEIRTHARNEPRTNKALKSRQSAIRENTFELRYCLPYIKS